MSEPQSEALVGRVLAGKYRLDARLRAGAMGAIYRAHHLSLDKSICIKIMHPQLAKEPQFAERFHREARAASRFDHPSSIHILDYGVDTDGTLYIAMELVDGSDLFELIDEANGSVGGIAAAFPARRIVDLLSQTLAALAAAHDVGILHRDLKPENIMVSTTWDDGVSERVKVCDFGIAHITEPQTRERLTRKGFILGTPEYMSPEQAKSEPVDARSDVYSCGVVLYQLLTGRVPFEDESPLGVAIKVINDQPVPPSELVPTVSPELEAICLRAMKKKPDERFASAREMRSALRELVGAPASTPIPFRQGPSSSPRSAPMSKEATADTLPAPLVTTVAPKNRPGSKWIFVVAAAMVLVAVGGFVATRSNHVALAAPVTPPTASEAPADVVVVAPVPTPAVIAIPAPVASFPLARVDLGAASPPVAAALTPLKPRIDACYKSALPSLGDKNTGNGTLRLEADATGTIRSVRVTGALASDVGTCIEKVVVGRHVDGGATTAAVPLAYRAK